MHKILMQDSLSNLLFLLIIQHSLFGNEHAIQIVCYTEEKDNWVEFKYFSLEHVTHKCLVCTIGCWKYVLKQN